MVRIKKHAQSRDQDEGGAWPAQIETQIELIFYLEQMAIVVSQLSQQGPVPEFYPFWTYC